MEKRNAFVLLNLHLFDGGEGGAGAGAGAGAAGNAAGGEGTANAAAQSAKGKAARNPLASIQYGKAPAAETQEAARQQTETAVTSDANEARKAEFEKLIKGDYKDLFDERMQRTINARFKETKALEAKAETADKMAPLLELLASKYGVDGSNPEAVLKAVQDDNSYYEEEAMEKGLSVDQLKRMKALERENAEFKRTAEEIQRKQAQDQIFAKWHEQAEACKQVYTGFDLQKEVRGEYGERFLSLLKSGVDVRTAFEVIHKDEIIGSAMQLTAQKVQEKTVADIRARGMRPSENGGAGASSAMIRKSDPRQLTKRDRDEISRRVLRGERIEF